MRGLERWGAKTIMDRAFDAFAALPAPEHAQNWWSVLEVSPGASEDDIRRAATRLARIYHPDNGSAPNERQMQIVNAAKDAGLKAVRSGC